MTDIKKQIAELRTWFIDNPAHTNQIKINYLKLLALLKEGERLSLKIGQFSCGALHELLAKDLDRVDKIERPDDILLMSEPNATADQLYSRLRHKIQIQLADV